MKVRFTKMHGIGNDFVVIDAISQNIKITPDRARQLADRHFGVGCDQVLVVQTPNSPDADFRYRIFNSNGEEVENCGNGARCFAIFVRMRRLTGKHTISVETASGKLLLRVQKDNSVIVDMGPPILNPSDIPFNASDTPFNTSDIAASYPLDVNGHMFSICAVSMGNPHAVLRVDDTQTCAIDSLGPLIEQHPQFPNKANVGFMQIISRQAINLRVYERGAGETLACGTGACAAVVAGIVQGLLDSKVSVHLPGGSLLIEWQGGSNAVLMSGPAAAVFHGQMKIT